jgi:hypothetical protein
MTFDESLQESREKRSRSFSRAENPIAFACVSAKELVPGSISVEMDFLVLLWQS